MKFTKIYVWGDTVGSVLKFNQAENSKNIRVGRYGGVVFENRNFVKKQKIYEWGEYVWVNTVVDVGGYCGAVCGGDEI